MFLLRLLEKKGEDLILLRLSKCCQGWFGCGCWGGKNDPEELTLASELKAGNVTRWLP